MFTDGTGTLPAGYLFCKSGRIFGTAEHEMLVHLEEGDVAETVGKNLTLKGLSHQFEAG
jgi:hypothetical protein